MRVEQEVRGGCVIVTLNGALDLGGVAEVRRVLWKRLADQPLAVICDLAGVCRVDPRSAGVFSSVAGHAAERWPETVLVLAGAAPEMVTALSRQGVTRLVPLYGTLKEAMRHVDERPSYRYDELLLMPTAAAPGIARRFVQGLYGSWWGPEGDGERPTAPIGTGKPTAELVDRVVLATSELVTNAVVHAKTPMRLWVELRGSWLRVSVDDRSPRPARPAEPALRPESEAGRGLQLVAALARSWGVESHRGGAGKTVWCAFRV